MYKKNSKSQTPESEVNPIKKQGAELNRELSTVETQMALKHLKKCLAFLVIREIQIKTTLRFYLIRVRIAKMKNSEVSRCWGGCEERNISPLLVGLQAGKTTLEISLSITPKIRHSIYLRTQLQYTQAYTQKILLHVIRTHAPLCSQLSY